MHIRAVHGKIDNMAGLTKKIAFNTVTQLISKLITTAISVVMLSVLARYLGVAGFGDYSTALAFVGFVAILADMGLYTIAVREVSKQEKDEKYILSNIFTLRIVLASLFLCIAPTIGFLIPVYTYDVKIGILIASIGSFFVLLDQIFVGVFQAHLKMHIRAWTEVVARTALLLMVLYFAWQGFPLIYFFIAQGIAHGLQALLSWRLSRRIISFGLAFDIEYWKKTLYEALPLGIVIALGMVYFKVDSVMLSLMTNSETVGIYTAPYKVLEVLILFPAIFMNSVFPVISRYVQQKDDRFDASFQKSFDFMSLFAFPILVGVLLAAKGIIHLIVGEAFVGSVQVLQVLIFAVFIIFFGTVFGNFIVAAGDQKKLVPIYITSAILNIVINYALIPHYSYLGAAFATVITEVFVCVAAFIFLYRKYRFSLSMLYSLKAALSAVVMGAVIMVTGLESLSLMIVVAILVYGASAVLFGLVRREHIQQIFRRI